MKQEHLYTSDEKLKWFGYGEWVEEADRIEFEHNGFQCLIMRIVTQDGPNHVFGGHLCGYIDLPKDHPFFGKSWVDDVNIDVHGGITYGEAIGDNWRIGFNCCHSGDYTPSAEKFRKERINLLIPIPKEYENHPIFNPPYRTVGYCIQECKNMAEQCLQAVTD